MPPSGATGFAASNYAQQDVRGETPIALVARVYDMAGAAVVRARAAAREGDWQVKGSAVRQAGRCISLLQCTLNRDKGGEIAENLDRVYGYLMRRLGEAHLTNDDAAFEEIERHVAELGAAWRTAAQRDASRASAKGSSDAEPRPAVAGAR